MKINLFIMFCFLLSMVFISFTSFADASENLDVSVRVIETDENISIDKQEIVKSLTEKITGLASLEIDTKKIKKIAVYCVVFVIILLVFYIVIKRMIRRSKEGKEIENKNG